MMDMNTADTQELIEAARNPAPRVSGCSRRPPPGPRTMPLLAIVGAVQQEAEASHRRVPRGADEPADTLAVKFAGLGLNEVVPALRVKEDPTEATYQLFEESGTDLGQVPTKKEALKAMKSAMSPAAARALGRVSGGLYVVTAAQGTATSAMVASWVAQASFEPLGFTVAIAKDRAIESLMQVGDRFVLNCLPEEGFEPIMKHSP